MDGCRREVETDRHGFAWRICVSSIAEVATPGEPFSQVFAILAPLCETPPPHSSGNEARLSFFHTTTRRTHARVPVPQALPRPPECGRACAAPRQRGVE